MSPPLAKARFSVDFFERNFNPCQGINRATAFPAQMRRTSIYSIPPGIQRLGAISQGDTRSGIAHPEPAREGVSPCPPKQEHSTSVAAVVAAGIVLFGLLSPAMAASDQNSPTVMR
jgi:hypothetical protein